MADEPIPETPSPEERAKLQAADTGGLEDNLQAEGDERPALNTPDGVDTALRDYATRIAAFRRAYLSAPQKGADATAFLNQESDRLRDAFFGRTQEFFTTAWNSPDQLGAFIGARVGISGEPEEVLQTYFFRIGRQILDITMAHEDRRRTDDETHFALDALLEEVSNALLGLPPIDAS